MFSERFEKKAVTPVFWRLCFCCAAAEDFFSKKGPM